MLGLPLDEALQFPEVSSIERIWTQYERNFGRSSRRAGPSSAAIVSNSSTCRSCAGLTVGLTVQRDTLRLARAPRELQH